MNIKYETAFNSYKVISPLGEGGSGKVYKAEDDSGEIYAIKCLDPDKATVEKRKRFLHEISFCRSKPHKNIVTVIDHGVYNTKTGNYPFYVMPFYPSTLRELIEEGIPPDQVVGFFSQILDGVEAAHLKFIWHRDLKPENILYDPNLYAFLVADFGIAHFTEEFLLTSLETNPKTRLANFQYSAPEQRKSGSKVDYRADIFSLGLILNEMFTKKVIQGSGYATIGSVAPDYTYLDEIVEGMVKQSPNERFDSIDNVKQLLILRNNDFISRQRLSSLTNKVITQSEIDDPLVNDPIRIVDFDYTDNRLIFTLNHEVNKKWVEAFKNIEHFVYQRNVFEPARFTFRENQAIITVPDGFELGQSVVTMSKDYIDKANKRYRIVLEEENRFLAKDELKRLNERIEKEKKRQEILQKLKI